MGWGWETGGFPTSEPGDELHFLGVTSYLDPEFEIDLGVDELTLHVHGLISMGEIDLGFMKRINYPGGYLELYQDSAKNADWGTYPPNATGPGTFADGELYFAGEFTEFHINYRTDGSGSFSGYLNGLSGTMIEGGCSECVYTWGGAFGRESSSQVLDGYDLQMDGVLEIDGAVASEPVSWDSVKALFNN